MLLDAHKIYCFHSFNWEDYDKDVATTIKDLAKESKLSKVADENRVDSKLVPSWLPEKLKAVALDSKYSNERLFEQKDRSPSTDLFVSILRLLGGVSKQLCCGYEVTATTKERLNKGLGLYDDSVANKDRYRYNMGIALSKAAENRLQNHLGEQYSALEQLRCYEFSKNTSTGRSKIVIPVIIDDLYVYKFSCQSVISQLSLQVKLPKSVPMTTFLLTEIQHVVARFANIVWLKTPPGKKEEGYKQAFENSGSLTVGSFVARLIFGENAETQATHRTFCHSYASIAKEEGPPDEVVLKDTAMRLARHYTYDYSVSENPSYLSNIMDFDNVLHTLTREGSATLIYPYTKNKKVDFLNNYDTNTLEKNYLPIIALNLLSYYESLEVLGEVSKNNHFNDIDVDIFNVQELKEKWRDLKSKLVSLNSHFTFHQVSHISTHNQFNDDLRDHLKIEDLESQLDKKLNRLSEAIDVAESINASRRGRWFKGLGKIGVVVGAVFVVAELINYYITFKKMGAEDYILFGAPIIIMLCVGSFLYCKDKSESKE